MNEASRIERLWRRALRRPRPSCDLCAKEVRETKLVCGVPVCADCEPITTELFTWPEARQATARSWSEQAAIDLMNARDRHQAAIRAVRDIHHPDSGRKDCDCLGCGRSWPCPTWQAIDHALAHGEEVNRS